MSIKFIIVGAPRTGSTLLVRTLNNVDGLCCHGELLADMVRGLQDGFDPLTASKDERDERASSLARRRDADPLGFILGALDTGHAAAGFKALYGNLLNPRWAQVVPALLATPGMKCIHLVRGNSLRRYVSEQILQAGGPNHSAAGGRSETLIKVHIDIDAYLRSTAETDAEASRVLALLAANEVLNISYEQLAADTAGTVATVSRFLGLETVPLDITPALQKVGAANLRDTVSNFQDLLDHPATRDMALAD